MNKFLLLFLSLLAISTGGFAETFILDNESPYPSTSQNTKMSIQWAYSGKDVDAANSATMTGVKLDPKTLDPVKKMGKVKVRIPNKAEYYRILVWTSGDENPDLVTNWVDVVPNKTYRLEKDHLVPSILMLGTGC